jgi:RNA polymerase sigma-70 factor (ECF subfamily)
LRQQRRRPSLRLCELWDDEHNELVLSEFLQDPHPLPQEIVEQLDLHAVLQQAIDELPPRCRWVVHLRFFGELSFSEIGQRLRIPPPQQKPAVIVLLSVSVAHSPTAGLLL